MKNPFTIIRLALLILCLAAMIAFLLAKGVILFDHSAEFTAEGLVWQETLYVPANEPYDHEKHPSGRPLAKTADGLWIIHEMKGDDDHRYLLVFAPLEQFLYVRADILNP